MKRRMSKALGKLLVVFAALGVPTFAWAMGETPHSRSERPNIVIVYMDDMGIGDLETYHPVSKIPTPVLNAFADSGVVFEDAHTPSAVCEVLPGIWTGA